MSTLRQIRKPIENIEIDDYISRKLRKQTENVKKETSNKSLLLTVPVYYYLDFIKMNITTILCCLIGLLAIIFVYIFAPSTINGYQKKLSYDLSLAKYDKLKSGSKYIQAYNPLIYEEMLQELRQMQQAAINLHKKQQASDRKTQALKRILQTMKNAASDSGGCNINDEKTKNMIKEALLMYDADKLGLRDYALETLGGSIISTPNTYAKLSQSYVFFGFIKLPIYSNPRVIIEPDVVPGKCFSFEGEQGKIRIKLSSEIFISAVTLEHAARSLLTQEEKASTPQQFQIKGLEYMYDEIGTILGEFTYAIDGPQRQTFIIPNNVELKPIQYIELYVLNNYGNIDSTCVYRLRVHGQQSQTN